MIFGIITNKQTIRLFVIFDKGISATTARHSLIEVVNFCGPLFCKNNNHYAWHQINGDMLDLLWSRCTDTSINVYVSHNMNIFIRQ